MLEHFPTLMDFVLVTDPDIVTNLAMKASRVKNSLFLVAPFRVINIGNSDMVGVDWLIAAIEEKCGLAYVKNLMPMKPGDVPATWADAFLLLKFTGYSPSTGVQEGVRELVKCYREYYNV